MYQISKSDWLRILHSMRLDGNLQHPIVEVVVMVKLHH